MVKMTGVMSLLYEHHSREFTTRKKKKEKTQTKTKDFENCFFTFLSPIVLCCSSSDYFVVVCYEQMLVRQVKTQMNCFLSFFRIYGCYVPSSLPDVWKYRISLRSPYAI